MKVVGICGSPRKGNTEWMLGIILQRFAQKEADVEFILLRKKSIKSCTGCLKCEAGGKERPGICVQKDDMEPLYPKILEADGLLLATPVYIGRLSGYLAMFMDRLRAFIHGNVHRGGLVDKVGGAMAVGWFRHAGLESALQSVVLGFLTYHMIPVGSLHCPWGAPAVASRGGAGKFDKAQRHGVLEDELGLQAAESLAARLITVVRKLKGEASGAA